MSAAADRLEEEAATLQNAVEALAALHRTPQERLDRALSYFGRTFRDPPAGAALPLWERIYAMLGNPPVGTPIGCRLETLSPDEIDALPVTLCRLAVEIARQAAAARSAG